MTALSAEGELTMDETEAHLKALELFLAAMVLALVHGNREHATAMIGAIERDAKATVSANAELVKPEDRDAAMLAIGNLANDMRYLIHTVEALNA